jgi:hypothetical protein
MVNEELLICAQCTANARQWGGSAAGQAKKSLVGASRTDKKTLGIATRRASRQIPIRLLTPPHANVLIGTGKVHPQIWVGLLQGTHGAPRAVFTPTMGLSHVQTLSRHASDIGNLRLPDWRIRSGTA